MSAIDNKAWRVMMYEDERMEHSYTVGKDGITRICLSEKDGEYSRIPYVQVWRDDILICEANQHKCHALQWEPPPAADDEVPF